MTQESARDGRIGRAVEDLVIAFVEDGNRHPSDGSIMRAARDHTVGQEGRASHRAANQQRICAGVMSFFALHETPDEWRLVGARVRFPGGEFDLVWERSDRKIVVDELKSGRLMRPLMLRHLRDQVARELAGGQRVYGNAFHGVRLLWLPNPRHSRFIPANVGALTELPE